MSAWHVETQTRSGLGELVWLRTAGPFPSRAQAQVIADRSSTRTGLATRVIEVQS